MIGWCVDGRSVGCLWRCQQVRFIRRAADLCDLCGSQTVFLWYAATVLQCAYFWPFFCNAESVFLARPDWTTHCRWGRQTAALLQQTAHTLYTIRVSYFNKFKLFSNLFSQQTAMGFSQNFFSYSTTCWMPFAKCHSHWRATTPRLAELSLTI